MAKRAVSEFNNNSTPLQKVELFYSTIQNAKIEKVASFCGAGLDEGEIYASKDADLLVSSDLRHHVIVKALDEGKNLMILTHYASENYGLKKFSEKMKETLKQNVYFYEDSTLL